MPLHIGIAACSAEGAALCYRTICQEGAARLSAEGYPPHTHPEVSMHTPSLADYNEPLERGDWAGVGAVMLASAHKLAAIGADFMICPDNTMHGCYEHVASHSPLPWIHIADVVAEEAAARGYKCLGLTGTGWLIDSAVYPDRLQARELAFKRPSEQERQDFTRIIMDELVMGVFKPEATVTFQTSIRSLKDAGCDAVVLGCTEIPLIIDDGNSALPTLDSTRLLARAALKRATGIT